LAKVKLQNYFIGGRNVKRWLRLEAWKLAQGVGERGESGHRGDQVK
jgi:hypothetical protein